MNREILVPPIGRLAQSWHPSDEWQYLGAPPPPTICPIINTKKYNLNDTLYGSYILCTLSILNFHLYCGGGGQPNARGGHLDFVKY